MSSIELDSDPSRVTAMSNSKSNYDTPSTEPVCKLSVMEIIAARYSGQTAMDKYQGKGQIAAFDFPVVNFPIKISTKTFLMHK